MEIFAAIMYLISGLLTLSAAADSPDAVYWYVAAAIWGVMAVMEIRDWFKWRDVRKTLKL